MDDRTGKIYEFGNEDILEIYKEKFHQVGSSMSELDKLPDANCPICNGRGGIKSKPYTKDGHICFYRPCKCTKAVAVNG